MNQKTILIVEDTDGVRQLLHKAVEGFDSSYKVKSLENGQLAKEELSKTTYDLIISDIQMPLLSGLELLEWIKKNKINSKFILMTGFTEILETKTADELGADDFVSKPFKNQEFKDKIYRVFNPPILPEGVYVDLDVSKKYCKVPIEDFVSKIQAEVNIFIRINDTKYIKISHKGGRIPIAKIGVLKSKGIDHLYVLQEDFKGLVGFSVAVSKAMATSKVDKEKRSKFIKYTGEMIAQQSLVNELDQSDLNNAKDFVTTVVDLLTEDSDTFFMLDCLKSHNDFLYSHAVATSLLSVMMAKELGWESPKTLFKLAFSGMFIDIGLKEIPKEILDKPRIKMTAEEIKLYESHTIRGKEILESLKTAPNDAIQVTLEHHETINGIGYPRRLTNHHLHPLTKVVAVADLFCSHVIKSASYHEPVSIEKAIDLIKTHKINEVDKDSLNALCAVLEKGKLKRT